MALECVKTSEEQQEAKILKPDRLKIPRDAERGEKILDGKGTLARLKEIEGFEWMVPLDLVTPNPNQPREYFDFAKMSDLKGTLKTIGQQVAVTVVPYEPVGTTGRAKLFIIDGERRVRALRELKHEKVRVSIRWEPTQYRIFLAAVLINESRADHNPIERAHIYQKLMERGPDGQPQSARAVAEQLGLAPTPVQNHLQLLKLSLEIQQMIITGQLPTVHALQIAQAQRKYQEKLNMVKLARFLLDNMEQDLDTSSPAIADTHVTRDSVQLAVRRALLEGGHEIDEKTFAAQKAFYDLLEGLNKASAGTRKFMSADAAAMIGILRERKEPPETVRDRVREVRAGLDRVLQVTEQSIRPDPLAKVPGKPSFEHFFARRKNKFGKPVRYEMACLLAKASDTADGDTRTARQLSNLLKVDLEVVVSNIKTLAVELWGIGIKLESHITREKDLTHKYVQKAAYRVAWKTDEPVADENKASKEPAQVAIQPPGEKGRPLIPPRGKNDTGHIEPIDEEELLDDPEDM